MGDFIHKTGAGRKRFFSAVIRHIASSSRSGLYEVIGVHVELVTTDHSLRAIRDRVTL